MRAVLLLFVLVGVDAAPSERLLLGALGLSEPLAAPDGAPGSRSPRHDVPPALWKMFWRLQRAQVDEGEPCIVSEYGVRGNIIRYVQDQGSGNGTTKTTSLCGYRQHAICLRLYVSVVCVCARV